MTAYRSEFLPTASKKRGRPKKAWTQADTARELGISQQSVGNAIRIAKAVEFCPELAKYNGRTILAALSFLSRKDPDNYDYSKLKGNACACVRIIGQRILNDGKVGGERQCDG